ncbi:MAG: porin [Verrucomicrobiota bacterium]
MKLKHKLSVAGVVGLLAFNSVAHADETADLIKSLKQQIDALDQKVRVLERNRELDQDAAVETAKAAPKIIIGNNGLNITSGDTNFAFALHGLLQVDNRSFFNDGNTRGNDSFLLRRARPIFSGTVYRDFDFMFVPDFGGSSVQIFDAYLNYRYRPWLQLRAGKFKPPVGLEQLQSDPVTLFNERSLATALTPGRDIGFQLWGDVADGRVSYAAGIFNGTADGRNSSNADFEDHHEFFGRIFAQPFKKSDVAGLRGLGFGVSGSWGNVSSNSAGLSNGFVTDGQQTFFAYTNNVVAAGNHWRLSPQAYYYYGPLSLLGEYVISDQNVQRNVGTKVFKADLQNTAWQIAAGWVLTGEDASYSGVTPLHPFDPFAGHWGALQLVGRFAELDVDKNTFPTFSNGGVSAQSAQSWSVGLNWYLNKNIRINTSYSRTDFTGGGAAKATSAPGTVTRQPEQLLFTRLQLAF